MPDKRPVAHAADLPAFDKETTPMDETRRAVVGVDVGGTKILVGSVGQDGTIYGSQRYPMDRTTQESALSSIDLAVEDFYRAVGAGPALVAMGVGVVGQADPATGTWVQAMNVPIHSSVQLAAQLEARYGLPVRIDNDVHAATMAELRLGAGRESRDFILFSVGTGLACGIVCNGQLVRGAANYAGEVGHMMVEMNGDLCEQCGRRGCLEPIGSGGGILAHVRAGLADHPASLLQEPVASGQCTAGTVFRAADAGDALASEIAGRATRAWGVALVNLVNLLNPEMIVLGGSVFRDGWGIAALRDSIAAHALPAARKSLRAIVPSRLGVNRVGLLGAAILGWEHLREIGVEMT
jgi:glucokinase